MKGADYNKLEIQESKRIGAKAHSNSGRGRVKGDASNHTFVIDYKFAKSSFTLNRNVWAKICTDAMKVDMSKSPMLYVVLGEGKDAIRLAVVEYAIMEQLMENNAENNT